MTRGFAVRLALSAVVLASIAIVLLHTLGLWSAGIIPLDVEQQANGLFAVGDANFRLPPPLVPGDVLALKEMTPAARAALLNNVGVPPDSSVEVAVFHGGRILRAAVATRPAPPDLRDWLSNAVNGFVITPFLAALALLTLWRGRDRVAAGLCIFTLYVLIAAGAMMDLSVMLAAPLASFWLIVFALEAQYIVAIPALYVMAEALAGVGVSIRTRTCARIVVASLAVLAVGFSLTQKVAPVCFGVAVSPVVASVANALIVALLAVAVLMLVAGYRNAPHESRLRIRWVLWSTALLLVCVLAVLALEPAQSRYPYLFQFIYAARFLSMGGYLYAAIRTRLVDVSFVVNRALVYAGITGLLFGIFSLLELGLHELAVSDKLSWALQAVAALLLAIALSPVHRRLEHWVERVFFHKQRRAIASLRTFAAECAFIEQQSRLFETAVARLHEQCDALAIYERTLCGYQLRGSTGRAWPESVDVDDPAFVSLRARRQEVDLHGHASAIGADSFAFPMIVGEMLSGAVICLPRAGEQFAPDIRAALAEAARNLGASLYILRYREQARLVADIAAGRIDELGARRRAVAMLEGATA